MNNETFDNLTVVLLPTTTSILMEIPYYVNEPQFHFITLDKCNQRTNSSVTKSITSSGNVLNFFYMVLQNQLYFGAMY